MATRAGTEWGQQFTLNLLRFQFQMQFAELIVGHLADFTPEGLEGAIQSNWSLFGLVTQMDPEQRDQYLNVLVSSLGGEGTEVPRDVIAQIIQEIEIPSLLGDIEVVDEDFGQVLNQHPGWLPAEIQKLQTLLRLTKE